MQNQMVPDVLAESPEQLCRALATGGAVWLRVSGKSMVPWVRPGDILFVRRAVFQHVSPGQVVLVLSRRQLVVHRVIGRCRAASGPALLTKGDAVADADPRVSPAELLGRVEWIERGGRRINLESLAQRALGWLLARASFLSRFCYPAAGLARRLLLGFGRPSL
jgi:hypothetical protein